MISSRSLVIRQTQIMIAEGFQNVAIGGRVLAGAACADPGQFLLQFFQMRNARADCLKLVRSNPVCVAAGFFWMEAEVNQFPDGVHRQTKIPAVF